MIIEYHRPESLGEAMELLARQTPPTVPLGGGTVLSRQHKPDVAVVDLQRLGLDGVTREGQLLRIGATATLQMFYDADGLPEGARGALRDALEREMGWNLRQMASMAGTLASCDGRSPFVTALLALDPRLVWAPANDVEGLGDYLPLREEFVRGQMILEVRVPANASLRFAMVARAPMDRPLVCAAVATWPSGRTRVTLGGFGKAPVLAMDGPEPGGAPVAAREAYRFAEDAWASAAYRMDAAARLVQRLVKQPADQAGQMQDGPEA
jgi:CO/xanthine dehydrogenase FAD-binding subunit